MNFKRIQIVFIFVFLFLDIFLFFNYKQTVNVQSSSERETTVNDAIDEMRKDNISIPNLSNKREQKGYLLSHSHIGVANSTIVEENYNSIKQNKYSLKTPIIIAKSSKISELEKAITKSGEINDFQDYIYSKELSTNKQFIFVQKYKNNLIYDLSGQLSLDLKGNVVSEYHISHVDSLSESKETETILSEKEAIVKLYTLNQIPNNTRILWRKLAYSWMLESNNVSVYVPIWFMALQNKRTQNITIEKINAFTGAPWKANFD